MWLRASITNSKFINNNLQIYFTYKYNSLEHYLILQNNTFYHNLNTPLVINSNSYQIFQELPIYNNIIAYNQGYGIDVQLDSFTTFGSCNNIYGNTLGNYNNIADQTGINNNISVNPKFCDTANGDYRIMDYSMCAPEFSPCGTLVGAYGVGCYNTPPQMTQVETNSILETQLLEFVVTANDIDGDSIYLSLDNAPTTTSIIDNLDGTGTVSFTPDTSQSGVMYINIIASDGHRADTQTVEITVIDANPAIESIYTDEMLLPQNLTNHMPVFSWSYTDPLVLKSQVQYEIAVGTDNDWTYAEMWNPAPFASSDTFITYNAVELIDGESYRCRIRVANSVAWSVWYEFGFRMNSIPTIPKPLTFDDYIFNTLSPEIWLLNSTDPEDLPQLKYGIEIYEDMLGSPVYSQAGYTQMTDSTACVVADPQIENSQYFWRSRAFDNYEYSGWSEFASFYINSTEEPPSQPVAIAPADTSNLLYNLMPTFNWSKVTDADPKDSVHYRFVLSLDSLFTFTTTINDIADTFYTVVNPLEYREQYWWKVTAIDITGLETVSAVATFKTSCCVGIRGNIDDDIDNVIDIADLVYFVDYQFRNGKTPKCFDESDLVIDQVIDITDLVFMVDYQFRNGDEPPACP